MCEHPSCQPRARVGRAHCGCPARGRQLMSVSANAEGRANSERLHMLLREKDPRFLAVLELAVNRVDRELSAECPETARR